MSNFPFSKTGETFQERPVYSAEISGKQVSLVTLKDETVYAQNLPNNSTLNSWSSSHGTAAKRQANTVGNSPGNFAEAELAGCPEHYRFVLPQPCVMP
jgi:hypothetical protein